MAKADRPRLWIKIDLGARGQIGPGKVALLRAIRAEQSIAGAARALGMSYRRAWLLVDEMSRTLGAPVIETHVGGRGRGGAVLTELGEALVVRYEAIQEAAAEAGAAELKRFRSLVKKD